MEEQSSYEIARLIAEFKRITREYDRALKSLDRRPEIVLQLVQAGLTHRQIGVLLGLSAGRIGQLVKEAPGYVHPLSEGS